MELKSTRLLEELLSGKIDCVEFEHDVLRENVIEQVNTILMSFFPGNWTHGEFVGTDTDYIVYDLQLLNAQGQENSKIRFFETSSKIRLVRING